MQKNKITRPLIHILIFILIENLVSYFILGKGLASFNLDQWTDLIIYKIGTLIVILILGIFYLRQRVYFNQLSRGTWIYIFIITCFNLFILYFFPKYLVAALIIGLAAAIPEELEFRGFIFGTLYETIDRTTSRKWNILWPIVLNGIIFSLSHLINLTSQTVMETMMQVIQTFGMGILLSAIYLRTKNLLVPMITHFSLNFFTTLINGIEPTKEQAKIMSALQVLLFYIVIAFFVLRKYEPTKSIGDKKTNSIQYKL